MIKCEINIVEFAMIADPTITRSIILWDGSKQYNGYINGGIQTKKNIVIPNPMNNCEPFLASLTLSLWNMSNIER